MTTPTICEESTEIVPARVRRIGDGDYDLVPGESYCEYFGQAEHVCDEPERHGGPHICPCGWRWPRL